MNKPIELSNLAYLNEIELFKIILSSADVFPGLYRMTSPWKITLEQNKYLKLLSFLEVLFQTENGVRWTRDQWMAAHENIYEMSYGKESRNEQRSENEIKEILKNKGYDWYKKPNSFSLALIDNSEILERIELNCTYYMMGSLIRFEKDQVRISHDDFSGKSVLTLNISYTEAIEYINATFSSLSISKLFLPAQIIAHLRFDSQNLGVLSYDISSVNNLFERFPPNCSIFAAPNYKNDLPIRFAKLIGVSNVLA